MSKTTINDGNRELIEALIEFAEENWSAFLSTAENHNIGEYVDMLLEDLKEELK